MKKNLYSIVFYLCLLSANSPVSKAQDYKLFYSNQNHFFNSGDVFQINWQSYFNSYSWSPIKESGFDSIVASVNDTLYFPFRTWRDTTDINDTVPPCGHKDGPSWMGISIHEVNGSTYLFNYDNDSILIIQSAALNQSWTMMNTDSGGHITASVDQIVLATVAGITDSVKQIVLTAYDNLGNNNPQHPLNLKEIWISKSNGLFKGLSFRELPQYAVHDRIPPIPTLTYGDLYNFDVGDEFEYIHSCQTLFTSLPPAWTLNKIIGKWYNASMDTVYYSRSNYQMAIQHNNFPPPPYINVFSQDTDTVSYTNLNAPVYTEFPEENSIQKFIMFPNFGVYAIDKDSFIYNNRIVYSEIGGFYETNNPPCIYFNSFEPIFYKSEISPGLGQTLTSYDYRSQASDYCEIRLIWYKKGTEIFGNYVSVISGVDELKNENAFQVYPNPATDQCMIFTDLNFFSKLEIFSFSGQKISELKISDHITPIDLSEFPKGIYLLKASSSTAVIIKKLIIF